MIFCLLNDLCFPIFMNIKKSLPRRSPIDRDLLNLYLFFLRKLFKN